MSERHFTVDTTEFTNTGEMAAYCREMANEKVAFACAWDYEAKRWKVSHPQRRDTEALAAKAVKEASA